AAGGGPKPNPTTTTTARRPAASAKPKRPGPGTVQFFTMPSGDGDGRRREFWVYRPGVPESSDLPIVYFLHGYPGNEHAVSESGLALTLEQLFASGVKPFVVVAPDGQSSPRRDTEWTDSAPPSKAPIGGTGRTVPSSDSPWAASER